MNSNYGRSNNKIGSASAFDFDLGLNSGRAKPMKDQKSQTSSYASTTYTQHTNAASSWTSQSSKPSWTHQPAASIQSGGTGSLSGPTSMVGDIFGKSWNSAAPSNSSASATGVVNNKNPNLFGDLLNSAMGQNKSSSKGPLKNAPSPTSHSSFSMGGMSDSLPKTNISAQTSGTWGSNPSDSSGNANSSGGYYKSPNIGGGNMNLMGNSDEKINLGGPSMNSMAGSNKRTSGLGSDKDPFASLGEFGSKQPDVVNSATKGNGVSDFGSYGEFQDATFQTSGSNFPSGAFNNNKSDPIGDFGFVNKHTQSQSQPLGQPSGANDFDALFSSSSNGGTGAGEGFTSQQPSGDDDWGINSGFEGGNDAVGTTELEGLPPPPAGVNASSAKNKGMDNYKQGQYSDAIKWLSWAVILLEKAKDDSGSVDVLTCRASCYKEVGEYKKAVADCTKVLEFDDKNVSVLVQRSLLYESMEKYKLGAEDLRTVLRLDPGNRVARGTIHRLTKMAG